MTLQIVLEPSEEGGFTAIVPSLPGCISEGRNREEALANIHGPSTFTSNPSKTMPGFPRRRKPPRFRYEGSEPPLRKVIHTLRRDGWVVVRQRGSHIRLQRQTPQGTLKVTVPAHRPILRSTLAHILKEARLTVDELNELL